MGTAIDILQAILGFIATAIAVRDWIQPLDRVSVWWAERDRRRAIKLLGYQDALSVRDAVTGWQLHPPSVSYEAGQKLGSAPAIAIERKNLDLIRDRAGLRRVDAWRKPYDHAIILQAYDEAIRELRKNLSDPDRKGRQTWPAVLILGAILLALQIWKAFL